MNKLNKEEQNSLDREILSFGYKAYDTDFFDSTEYKNLLNQLTITPQRKEILLHNDYTSNSDFVIVNEVLDNFVK